MSCTARSGVVLATGLEFRRQLLHRALERATYFGDAAEGYLGMVGAALGRFERAGNHLEDSGAAESLRESLRLGAQGLRLAARAFEDADTDLEIASLDAAADRRLTEQWEAAG